MPRSKSGSLNGGIIGKKNVTSFGKDKVTTKTSSGCLTTQSSTRVVQASIVAGGGGGAAGCGGGGGGGAGGFICKEINVCGSTTYPITVGAGGAGGTGPEGSAPGCAEGASNCIMSDCSTIPTFTFSEPPVLFEMNNFPLINVAPGHV